MFALLANAIEKLPHPLSHRFINPKLTPIYSGDKLIDVKVSYPTDFTGQMLEYGKQYSLLPTMN